MPNSRFATSRRRRTCPVALGDCRTPAERLADAHRRLRAPGHHVLPPAHLRAGALSLRDALLAKVDFSKAGSPQRRALLRLAARLLDATEGHVPAADLPALLQEARAALGVLL